MQRPTAKPSIIMVALLLATAYAAPAEAKYYPPEFFELAGLAEVVVLGEIVRVDDDTFTLSVREVLAGRADTAEVEVVRFVDWTCSQRWKPYAVGQREIAFLHRLDDSEARATGARFGLLSSGDEGEWEILGTEVSVQGALHLNSLPKGSSASSQLPLTPSASVASVSRGRSGPSATSLTAPRYARCARTRGERCGEEPTVPAGARAFRCKAGSGFARGRRADRRSGGVPRPVAAARHRHRRLRQYRRCFSVTAEDRAAHVRQLCGARELARYRRQSPFHEHLATTSEWQAQAASIPSPTSGPLPPEQLRQTRWTGRVDLTVTMPPRSVARERRSIAAARPRAAALPWSADS